MHQFLALTALALRLDNALHNLLMEDYVIKQVAYDIYSRDNASYMMKRVELLDFVNAEAKRSGSSSRDR